MFTVQALAAGATIPIAMALPFYPVKDIAPRQCFVPLIRVYDQRWYCLEVQGTLVCTVALTPVPEASWD